MKFFLLIVAIAGVLTMVSANSNETVPEFDCQIYSFTIPEVSKCTVCEDVVKLISFQVREANATIEDVIKLVEDICADFNNPIITKECNFFLSKVKVIVEWVTKGLSSDEICDKLEFCNSFEKRPFDEEKNIEYEFVFIEWLSNPLPNDDSTD